MNKRAKKEFSKSWKVGLRRLICIKLILLKINLIQVNPETFSLVHELEKKPWKKDEKDPN